MAEGLSVMSLAKMEQEITGKFHPLYESGCYSFMLISDSASLNGSVFSFFNSGKDKISLIAAQIMDAYRAELIICPGVSCYHHNNEEIHDHPTNRKSVTEILF